MRDSFSGQGPGPLAGPGVTSMCIETVTRAERYDTPAQQLEREDLSPTTFRVIMVECIDLNTCIHYQESEWCKIMMTSTVTVLVTCL